MRKKTYKSIKDLVFDLIHRTSGLIDYKTLTHQVKQAFPNSKWKKSHWAWYRSQIKIGRFKELFSKKERQNLFGEPKERLQGERLELGEEVQEREVSDIKRVGDAILSHVRFVINETITDDASRFKLNRWVYSRLQQDENKQKRPIKQKMWDYGIQSCQACGKNFNTSKGVEIHRKDSSKGYSVENCELLCRPCHQLKRRK